MIRRHLARRSSVAAWLLMLGLSVAPSLALVAMGCAPNCCPTSAHAAAGGTAGNTTGRAEVERDDCRAGFASRACCSEAPAPLASAAPNTVEISSLPAILARSVVFAVVGLAAPRPCAEAELALRTSPLRLSVVLLI